MTVRQASKHDLAAALQARYWKATRQQKGQMLDEFCNEATRLRRGAVSHEWDSKMMSCYVC